MKRNFYFSMAIMLITAFTFSFTSCKQAMDNATAEAVEVDMDAVKAEIQAMEDAFAAGLAAGDAVAVSAYYADDAMSLSNNAPMVSGKEAITAKIAEDIAANTTKTTSKFEVVDIKISGDLVVEVGKGITMDSTGAVTKTGKYISVFEKRDGKYVCIRDCYNDDSK